MRNLGEPFIDGLWDVFDDLRWVVRFLVDVKWDVVGLGIRHVCTVERLRVRSRKLTIFLLASIVILRPCSLKMVHRSFLISSTWRGVAFVIPRQPGTRKSRTQVEIPFRTIFRVFTLCLFILSLTGLSSFVLFIFVKKAYKPSFQSAPVKTLKFVGRPVSHKALSSAALLRGRPDGVVVNTSALES